VFIDEFKHTGKLLCCEIAMDRESMIIINAFPGHTKWDQRNLVVRPTGANIDYLLEHWTDAEWLPAAAAIRDEYLAKRRAAAELMEAKRGQFADKEFPYKTVPYAHQEHAFILQRDVPSFCAAHGHGHRQDQGGHRYRSLPLPTGEAGCCVGVCLAIWSP
jgi:hypothetical protein